MHQVGDSVNSGFSAGAWLGLIYICACVPILKNISIDAVSLTPNLCWRDVTLRHESVQSLTKNFKK
jgi:hypothetical protein